MKKRVRKAVYFKIHDFFSGQQLRLKIQYKKEYSGRMSYKQRAVWHLKDGFVSWGCYRFDPWLS